MVHAEGMKLVRDSFLLRKHEGRDIGVKGRITVKLILVLQSGKLGRFFFFFFLFRLKIDSGFLATR